MPIIPKMPKTQKDFDTVDAAAWDELARAAIDVCRNAHIPYSHFPVGAALLTRSGEIITGCNVEIASIGATSCAERTAVGNAVTRGHKDFVALVVATRADPPSAPCGICRQVLAEFSNDLPILLVNPSGDRQRTTLDELLPLRFSGRDMHYE